MTQKSVSLQPEQVSVFRESHVLHAQIVKGILICAFDPTTRIGGAYFCADPLSAVLESNLDVFLGQVADVTQGGTVLGTLHVKLVGFKAGADKVHALLKDRGVSVDGESFQKDSIEAYFYTESGRLRVAPLEASTSVISRQTSRLDAGQECTRKKVLIVDDSKTIRQLLSKILSADPELEVVGAADRPSVAEKMMQELKPDVITLDIHMPEMDGVTFLEKYLPIFRIPTIMITSISMEEGNYVLHALEAGAVDYIQKPSFEVLNKLAPLIQEKVKMAAHISVKKIGRDPVQHRRLIHRGKANLTHLVAVGSSTGGTEALRNFLGKLPQEIPPIVIVQHIPPVFSKAFANRMASLCPFEVKEAEDGDEARPNRVLIAPGGLQMEVVRSKGDSGFKVRVYEAEPVNRHKPSVDVLFNSVAKEVGKSAIGIILTGMGKDGAAGMLKMKQAGARTIAQDEASCVVFGMPKEAIKLGAAETVQPLDKIPETLVSWL